MAARKSQLFLNSVIPVTRTHDELVQKKLKRGKFVYTLTGYVKIAGIICLLAGVTFFLVSSSCDEDATWKKCFFLFANIANILVTFALYVIFAAGLTLNRPWTWVKTDIILNIIFSLITIISSPIITTSCKGSSLLHKLPGPFAIAGGITVMVSCAAITLLYRYKDDVNEPKAPKPPEEQPRKSIFA